MSSLVNTDGLNCCLPLSSARLSFQTIKEEEIREIVQLLSDYETVWMLTYAPWPYTVQEAAVWVNHVNQMCRNGVGRFWGVHDGMGTFIGTAGLSLFPEHEKGELHYWLGKA
jgi:RimJ/RimL family protein N-acetyltransferase